MTPQGLHPLAVDYLRRLREAGVGLPPDRLAELGAEIEEHLSEAIPSDASEEEALAALRRLGPPGDIVEAERPAVAGPADLRGRREWAALILLPLGGFAFGVGWLVGLAALWSSRLWTTREKLIGTLIVPGGIATALLVVVATGTKRRCIGFDGGPVHCTPSGGPGAAMAALRIVLVVLCVLGPIVSAVYLARRARGRSGYIGRLPGPMRSVPGAAG